MPTIFRPRIPRQAVELEQATEFLKEIERREGDCRANLNPVINDLERTLKRVKKRRDTRLKSLAAARERWLKAMGRSAKQFKKRFLGSGCKTLKLDNGYEVRWRDQPDNLVVVDADAAIAWLKEQGHDDLVLVKETLVIEGLERNRDLAEQVPGLRYEKVPERGYLYRPGTSSGTRIF